MTVEKALCDIISIIRIPNILHNSFKLRNFPHALYILMQKTVRLNTCRIVRKFVAETWIISSYLWEPYSFENRLESCKVREVDIDDDDYDNDNNNVCSTTL
jgi:hypothetical protein